MVMAVISQVAPLTHRPHMPFVTTGFVMAQMGDGEHHAPIRLRQQRPMSPPTASAGLAVALMDTPAFSTTLAPSPRATETNPL